MAKAGGLALVLACITWAGCGFPRPAPFGDKDAGDDGGSKLSCTANQALRCEGTSLVRCDAAGTAEVSEACLLGCSAQLRCNDVEPSNGLAPYLDMASNEPDLDLGSSATINVDDGTVTVDGKPVAVKTTLIAQTSAPSVRVFIVHSLVTGAVTVTTNKVNGSNAIAIVSGGDLKIGGVFTASASSVLPGAGGFNDGACRGGDVKTVSGPGVSGAGGGGFGLAGGAGGAATNDSGTATGGAAGSATGNATLIPLRGGCDGGRNGSAAGSGGGAIQLVSRTKIAITGVVAANGSSDGGGGSGGGILLEAAAVEISGAVVANGGAGSGGCGFPQPAEDGRLDAAPATGGIGCTASGGVDGGNGGAGNAGARGGAAVNRAGSGSSLAFGGYGGGSVGRIRVNTSPGGLHMTGLFSPNPSTGAIATR